MDILQSAKIISMAKEQYRLSENWRFYKTKKNFTTFVILRLDLQFLFFYSVCQTPGIVFCIHYSALMQNWKKLKTLAGIFYTLERG